MADTTTRSDALSALTPKQLRDLASDLRRTAKHLLCVIDRLRAGEDDVVCRIRVPDGGDAEIALGIHQLIPIIADRRVRMMDFATRFMDMARAADRARGDGPGVAASAEEG